MPSLGGRCPHWAPPATCGPRQFTDGDWQVRGPDSLTEALRERPDASVELLAFAPDNGYMLWDDGMAQWLGLPQALHNQLRGRKRSLPGVEFLACGPGGEWFVRYLDGSWRSGGLQGHCPGTLEELKAEGRDVLKCLFGTDGTWAVICE
jgi:hypothetical protein